LKNWRRGVQDVEYLVLARQAGEGTLADQVLDALVPRALDENGLSAGESVPWEEDGEVWLQQRRRLADLFPPGVEPDADGGTAPDGTGPLDGAGGDPGDYGTEGGDGGSPGDDGGPHSDDGSGKVEGSGCGCGAPNAGYAPGLVLVLFFFVGRRR
jgi:uncharacterized protein (TIGR03382 family)